MIRPNNDLCRHLDQSPHWSLGGWALLFTVQVVSAVVAGIVWIALSGSEGLAAVEPSPQMALEVVQPPLELATLPAPQRRRPVRQKLPAPQPVVENPLPKPQPFSMQTVVDTVRAEAKTVEPCLRTALEDGEIQANVPHRLVLAWEINPDGSVASPRITGPEHLRHTSMVICLPHPMLNWRFPPPGRRVPIRNYAFGPFTIR